MRVCAMCEHLHHFHKHYYKSMIQGIL